MDPLLNVLYSVDMCDIIVSGVLPQKCADNFKPYTPSLFTDDRP